MPRLSVIARAGALGLVLTSLIASPALAKDASIAEPVAAQVAGQGGGDAAPANGVYLPESAAAKERQHVAHLYDVAMQQSATAQNAKSTTSSAWATFEAARVAFEARYGVELAAPLATGSVALDGSSRVQAAAATATLSTYKTLNVTWVRQAKDFYCGPATAYMILKYSGFTKSKLDGAALSQSALAGSKYLQTDAKGLSSTWTFYDSGFTVNDMSRGLNQWAYGSVQNAYYPQKVLTADSLKEAYRYSVDNNRAVAVSTYEKPNGPRYNSHPASRTGDIGHWVAVYGYEASGATAKVADPASGMAGYTNSAQKFYITTDSLYSYAVSRYAVW